MACWGDAAVSGWWDCGMILVVPRAYRRADLRFPGLAANNVARLQGFFMLRRFLKTPGYDLYHASSCDSR